jgi:UDP-N-acetylmuramoylalanine--D-glutamate ligase
VVENKYVFVYGAGISGCGVAEVLAKNGEKVILFNDEHKHIDAALVVILLKNGGKFICQQNPDEYLEETGLVIISPGISIKCSLAEKAKNMGIEVISEVEEASRLYKGRWIGITGTNGKTTTTTLVGEMMKSLPVKTRVGGNIGVAISKEAEGMGAEDWLIAELSSFQLEGVSTLKPNIALILNITPDHIDRHGSMENYITAKANIFAKQTREDLLILNNDDKTVRHLAEKAKSTVCYISRKRILGRGVFVEDGKFVIAWGGERIVVCAVNDMKIFGSHNEENVLGAIACAYFAGVSIEEIRHVLKTFEGVEHRLEYVMDVAGVPYYNDSKATNPDSTIKALESFSGHVILLAGGHDKMTALGPMMKLVKEKTDALILLGEAKTRFYEAALAADVKNIYLVDTFAEAVNKAHALARKPQVVVLSPACSSYDMFENFPQRGRVFKELVRQLAD